MNTISGCLNYPGSKQESNTIQIGKFPIRIRTTLVESILDLPQIETFVIYAIHSDINGNGAPWLNEKSQSVN